VLADAGYLSENNLTRPGPARLIATAKTRDLPAHTTQDNLPPAEEARTIEGMRASLATTEGAALYKRRATIVEPLFGQAKHDRGFRRFSRRGLDAADAEWKLLCACHNILKLFGARTATA
jgi:DDE family transposase